MQHEQRCRTHPSGAWGAIWRPFLGPCRSSSERVKQSCMFGPFGGRERARSTSSVDLCSRAVFVMGMQPLSWEGGKAVGWAVGVP
eukprot:2925641-Alexandrium_andersonii.AAC.1